MIARSHNYLSTYTNYLYPFFWHFSNAHFVISSEKERFFSFTFYSWYTATNTVKSEVTLKIFFYLNMQINLRHDTVETK